MKSMQRQFGKFTKRTDDVADVGSVLAEFKAADEMLERLVKDLKAWKEGWEDLLKLQYDAAEAFTTLYKPIDPSDDPEVRHKPTPTPQKYTTKCLGLQKLFSDLQNELQQEMAMITSKLVNPAEEARQQLKPLKRTIKHRENMKLDYERYAGRADHVRKKDTRSAKEEAVLAKHESDLAQAHIDYQTADDQVKETFPPLIAAIKTLLPYLLSAQIKIQTTLVGQYYTVMDDYTKKQGLPNPAPPEAQIIRQWDQDFTSFRKELEGGLSTIANGKAINMPMTLPEKDRSTLTGYGLRNRVMNRKSSNQGSIPTRESIASGTNANAFDEEEEAPPVKPPRPGTVRTPSIPTTTPSIPTSSKPRISSSNAPPPYSPLGDQKPGAATPDYPKSPNPWSDQASLGGATPPSRYGTPLGNTTSGNGTDYFTQGQQIRRPSTASSISAASIAGKKKPPPVPTKRLPSMQAQYVTAVFDFEGQNEGDLAFREGDRIKVVKKTDSVDDWWDGELRGVVGCFPANYVKV